MNAQPIRILGDDEVVEIGHWFRWSAKPDDRWTQIVNRWQITIGLPVSSIRTRHGQPDLQFAAVID